jgi:uncharacterized protein (DUF885 family)
MPCIFLGAKEPRFDQPSILNHVCRMSPTMLSRRGALHLLAAGGSALIFPTGVAEGRSPRDAAALLDAVAWRLLETDPEQATALGLDKEAHAGLRARLKDRSAAGIACVAAQVRDDLAKVDALDRAGRDPAEGTSLAVVRSAYRLALDGFALPYGDVAVGGWRNAPYVVIQNVGAYLDTPRFLEADHPVHGAEDAEAYLARLRAMAGQLDGELERMRAAAAMGVVPPDFLLDRTIAQLRRTIVGAQAGGGGMVRSLVRRTASLPGAWEQRAAAIVREAVLPALERQLAEIAAQRRRATSAPGLKARPHGEAWYAWALRAATTTSRTPDEVHALGREELAALQARMDPILRSLGFTTGTVGERMTALGRDPRFRFVNDDAGRAEIIALMQSKIDFIRRRLPLAFRRLVSGRLEIRRLPEAEEAGAPNAYGGPGSIDGATPGKIWVNLGNTDRHTRYSVPTLAFHEGIPGHVWQGEYANRLPLIRSLLSFNAYSEGWALYAEQLGEELGAYEGDPVGRLGFLQSLAFRACRMVVDTGLHARGWTRERAIDWFAATNGSGRAEVTAEVDRYCSWPGQACGYKMGHSEILHQRERAKRALGECYDLRDFDQAVVDGGNVPLDVLGENVERYIAGARQSVG